MRKPWSSYLSKVSRVPELSVRVTDAEKDLPEPSAQPLLEKYVTFGSETFLDVTAVQLLPLNSISIAGAVARFETSRIAHGWALSQLDRVEKLVVAVIHRGQPVTASVSWYSRPDVTGGDENQAGFAIQLVADFDAVNWLNGTTQIIVTRDGRMAALPITDHALRSAIANLVADQVSAFGADFLVSIVNSVAAKLVMAPAQQSALAKAVGPLVSPVKSLEHMHGTEVCIEVGTKTFDGAVVMGRGGHAFLIGGTNNVSDQYKAEEFDQETISACEAWFETIKNRAVLSAQDGARFFQIVIPEKQSVMPELFPEKITVPSSRLRRLEQKIASNPTVRQAYISAYSSFSSHSSPQTLYRKIDTHFSEVGCFVLFNSFLTQAGESELPKLVSHETDAYRGGDLSNRFFGVPLLNRVLKCEADSYIENARVKLVEEHEPESDAHIGRRYAWSSEFSRSPLKVVAFGNSFFERGRGPSELSWWFARYFREFHFVWSPDYDADYVRKVSPDVVVCQTIERFLTKIPKG